MSDSFLYHVFFALIFAIGVWMLVSGIAGGFGAAQKRIAPLPVEKDARDDLRISDLPPFAQRLVSQPLTDLAWLLFRNQDHNSVEDRLRRSGWRYSSVGDYYGSKITNAVMFFVTGSVCAALMGLPLWLFVALAAGLGVVGLYRPDEKVSLTLKERRENLFREMAWTLDRVAMVMKTGEALEPTLNRLTDENYGWVGGGSGGLFVALLRDIAAGLSSHRHDVEEMLKEVRTRLPDDLPELDEFLLAVQANLEKRQPIVEQLRALGQNMRDKLNHRIEETAQKAELKVVALTSGVIVPTLLLVVGGAALLGFIGRF
jgi:Flp pilus assembly protein TadB